MFQQYARFTSMPPIVALTAVLLLASGHALAGAPLKGVDVKLGRNPGGSPVARTTTDASGAFAFADLPAGSYTVTFERPAEPKATPGSAASARAASAPTAQVAQVARARVNIVAGGQTIVGYWDFDNRTAVDSALAPAKAGGTGLTVDMKAPGRLAGTCESEVVMTRPKSSAQ